jgi:hypothetical protein
MESKFHFKDLLMEYDGLKESNEVELLESLWFEHDKDNNGVLDK